MCAVVPVTSSCFLSFYPEVENAMAKAKILLLVDKDSDNAGDQLVEETLTALLAGAMTNLGFPPEDVELLSRSLGIVPKKYVETNQDSLLDAAREIVGRADVVVIEASLLGLPSHPRWNQASTILQIARKQSVPVLFLGADVQSLQEADRRGTGLLNSLGAPTVKLITTGGDSTPVVELLPEYVGSVVSTPSAGVLGGAVFQAQKAPASVSPGVIGLVVGRAEGINASDAEVRNFWLEVIDLLTARGLDYRLFAMGDSPDEYFLYSLVRENGIAHSKVRFIINSAQELVHEVAACTGVIAMNLNVGIAAYACQIPAVNLQVEPGVLSFYRSIGHPDRAISKHDWHALQVVDSLQAAIGGGTDRNEEFTMSAYISLFEGLKEAIDPGSPIPPYSYEQLTVNLPLVGVAHARYRDRANRKLRRAYESHYAAVTAGKVKSGRLKSALKRVARKLRALAKELRGKPQGHS